MKVSALIKLERCEETNILLDRVIKIRSDIPFPVKKKI